MGSIRTGSYQDLKPFFGDIHNHCEVSYGQGPLEAAFRNARLQLDFVSVTVHADWPDLPKNDQGLKYLVDYHRKGFEKAVSNWPGYLKAVERENADGEFVVFPSFEWHSNQFGDYCVYYRDTEDVSILRADDLKSLREEAGHSPSSVFIIPHHIGYRTGSRGINWSAFSDEYTPVVEIFSFHGLSESSEGPYPYLHSMGPVHEHSTAQYGWAQGNRFGVIGSTDHHNAFPGSYSYGRMGVWAEELTREALWDAISKRRTYALTGDRIELEYSLNGCLMGDTCPADSRRTMDVTVRGGDALDYVEVLHNNGVLHRESILPGPASLERCKVLFEVGWGEGFESYSWDVELQVVDGELLEVEPRFQGFIPTEKPEGEVFTGTDWSREGSYVRFHTSTRPNIASRISLNAAVSLEIEGGEDAVLKAKVNGQRFEVALSEIRTGSRTYNLGGFVSPAVCFHRAIPEAEYLHRFQFDHQMESEQRDWYYVRVRQRNGQYAWSSPIWVDGLNE